MARIVCFTDDSRIARTVQQELVESGHDLRFLSASRLCNEVRETVRHLNPEVILLELTSTLDNPHLYIFLRSDDATRGTPVLLLSNSARHQHHADVLGADGVLLRPLLSEQLQPAIAAHVLPMHALVAA